VCRITSINIESDSTIEYTFDDSECAYCDEKTISPLPEGHVTIRKGKYKGSRGIVKKVNKKTCTVALNHGETVRISINYLEACTETIEEKPSHSFKVGDTVVIIQGAYTGYKGKIKSIYQTEQHAVKAYIDIHSSDDYELYTSIRNIMNVKDVKKPTNIYKKHQWVIVHQDNITLPAIVHRTPKKDDKYIQVRIDESKPTKIQINKISPYNPPKTKLEIHDTIRIIKGTHKGTIATIVNILPDKSLSIMTPCKSIVTFPHDHAILFAYKHNDSVVMTKTSMYDLHGTIINRASEFTYKVRINSKEYYIQYHEMIRTRSYNSTLTQDVLNIIKNNVSIQINEEHGTYLTNKYHNISLNINDETFTEDTIG
jgi:transcription antitermination factor NusG